MLLITPQNLDKSLYNTILSFKEPTQELASIFLQHLKFMQDENVKNKDDSNYKKEYLSDVRKFIVTVANIIIGKQSYFIKQKSQNDFCINLLGTQIVKRFLHDNNFMSSLEIQKYLENAVRYLSNKWFCMELDDFISEYTELKDKIKKQNNTVSKEIEKEPVLAALESYNDDRKRIAGFGNDMSLGMRR